MTAVKNIYKIVRIVSANLLILHSMQNQQIPTKIPSVYDI